MMGVVPGEPRRFVAEYEHDLVFYIKSGVIVIVELFGSRAVSGEDERCVDPIRGYEAVGYQNLVDPDFALSSPGNDGKRVVRVQARTCDHGEWLGISVDPGRIDVEFLVALLDQVLGASQPFGPGAATFHFWRGQFP